MKQIIKNTAVLLIITLIAGISLACINEITKKPIADAEEEAKNEAYLAVFPEAESFGENGVDLSSFDKDSSVTINEVKTALSADGKALGWVMNLTTSKGYGGDINLAVGIKADGTINALTVISMSETAGLGAKCTSESFLSQFSGIKADRLEVVKEAASKDNEVVAISGATITTSAVTGAVNEALALVYEKLSAAE